MPLDQELRPILKELVQDPALYDATSNVTSTLPPIEDPSSGGENKQPANAGSSRTKVPDVDDNDSCCCEEGDGCEDSGADSVPCCWYRCKFGEQWKHFMLTAASVVMAVVTVVTLPICLAGMDRVHGDAYTLMYLGPFWSTVFFILLPIPVILCSSHRDWLQYKPVSPHLILAMGLCNLFGQMLQLYAGVPRRTPAHLQVVLSTILIPATVLFRNQVFKEGLQRRQWACIIVVIIGLLISMIPQFVALTNPQKEPPVPLWNDSMVSVVEQEEEQQSTLPLHARILWPMGFVLGFLPQAAMIVMAEKHLKVDGGNPLVLCTYIQLITFIGALLLFWTDLIPGFGLAPSFREFRVHQTRAAQCMFGWGDRCDLLTARIWTYFFTYAAGFLFQILIIRYAEGAIYSVLVLALVLPLGSMFWALFGDNERYGRLVWDPQFETSTVFSLSGILILIPPIAFYDYFGIQERRQQQLQQLH